MIKPKEQLNKWYQKQDPWEYRTTLDDKTRKEIIINKLKSFGKFERALDIGCGEGFITESLPAKEIYGYDESDIAMSRVPTNIQAIEKNQIKGLYDLIIATGVMYRDYDFQWIIDKINTHASGIVLLCNIDISEVKEINQLKNQIYYKEFPYRKWNERLRIYDYCT